MQYLCNLTKNVNGLQFHDHEYGELLFVSIAVVQSRMVIIRSICMRIQCQLCTYTEDSRFSIMALWFKSNSRRGVLQNASLQKYYSPSIKQYRKHVMMIIPGYVNWETGKLVVKVPHHKNNDCVSTWIGHLSPRSDFERRQNEFAELALFFNVGIPSKPVS